MQVSLSGARRIHLLAVLKWVVLLLPPVVAFKLAGVRPVSFLLLVVSLLAFGALRAWEDSRRRQFIREARFPPYIVNKLRAKYPQLSAGDADLVMRGLRQFLVAHLRSQRRFVAMPSQGVAAAEIEPAR